MKEKTLERFDVRISHARPEESSTLNTIRQIAKRRGWSEAQTIKWICIMFAPAAAATEFLDIAAQQQKIVAMLTNGSLPGVPQPIEYDEPITEHFQITSF